jgi:hypothetical protein
MSPSNNRPAPLLLSPIPLHRSLLCRPRLRSTYPVTPGHYGLILPGLGCVCHRARAEGKEKEKKKRKKRKREREREREREKGRGGRGRKRKGKGKESAPIAQTGQDMRVDKRTRKEKESIKFCFAASSIFVTRASLTSSNSNDSSLSDPVRHGRGKARKKVE